MSHTTSRPRRTRIAISVAMAAAALALSPQSANAGSDNDAEVNVVHGIPGTPVKVCVNGQPAIRGFDFGETVVGVALPPGTYRVRVVPEGKACGSSPVLQKRYSLEAGKSYTILAALKPSGTPALKPFQNRVRPTDAGTARLTVRHGAQAPAVNVWADGNKLIGGNAFTWGTQKTIAVPAGKYRVKVTLPGARRPVIGPQQLTLRAGNAYQVHAVGKAGDYRLVAVKDRVGSD